MRTMIIILTIWYRHCFLQELWTGYQPWQLLAQFILFIFKLYILPFQMVEAVNSQDQSNSRLHPHKAGENESQH